VSVVNRFAAVRAGYGVLLLGAPGPVIRLYTGHRADPRTRMVARLLGARHLAQAVATAGPAGRGVLALGVEVDLAHVVSMVGLAGWDRARRRAGLVDAAAAGSFALVGAALTRRGSALPSQTGGNGPLGGLAARRQSVAAWLGRWLLPVSLRPPDDPGEHPRRPGSDDRPGGSAGPMRDARGRCGR